VSPKVTLVTVSLFHPPACCESTRQRGDLSSSRLTVRRVAIYSFRRACVRAYLYIRGSRPKIKSRTRWHVHDWKRRVALFWRSRRVTLGNIKLLPNSWTCIFECEHAYIPRGLSRWLLNMHERLNWNVSGRVRKWMIILSKSERIRWNYLPRKIVEKTFLQKEIQWEIILRVNKIFVDSCSFLPI